jgi:adenosylhomocysteinase
MNYDIRDLSFAERGRQRIAWAARNMPVLRQIQAEFANQRPLQNRRIAAYHN